MKMTERMLQSVKEELRMATQAEGHEITDEMLDEVVGGRDLTDAENEWITKFEQYPAAWNQKYMENYRCYRKYIELLPDDAPEETYKLGVNYTEKLVNYITEHNLVIENWF